MAVRFDAQNDYLSYAGGPDVSAAYTVCFWGYLTADRNDWSGFWAFDGPAISYTTLATTNDGTTLYFYGNDAEAGSVSYSIKALVTGTWYFMAHVGNGANQDSYCAAVSETSLTTAGGAFNNATLFVPDSTIFGHDTVASERIDGRVFAAKMWSTNLTQAEIEQERWSIRPHRTANLYGWWPIFPDAVERAREYSGNGRDFTENGALTDEDPPPVSWGTGPLMGPFLAAEEVRSPRYGFILHQIPGIV